MVPLRALTDPRFMVAVLCATLCGLFRFSTRIDKFNQALAVLGCHWIWVRFRGGNDKALAAGVHWLRRHFVERG